MIAKVLKAFKDKDTKSILRPGQIIEITEERFEELTSSPLGIFVEEVVEKEEAKEEVEEKKKSAKK